VATHDLQVVPATLGPRLGGQTQQVIKAVKSGDWHRQGDSVIAGGIELVPGEFQLKLVVAGDGASTSLSGGAGVIVLDTEVTAELEAEGVARDLVRLVQQARRDAGLAVSDRIALRLGVPESVRRQIVAHQGFVAEETLSTSVSFDATGDPTGELDGEPVVIGVTRA
jgi:isoleucyl-tRNA synthetase